MLILPNGLPASRKREPLGRDEIDLVQRFEAWLSKRNLKMDLICETCFEDGAGAAARCSGENSRNSSEYKISCGHADRVYGVPLTEH